MSKLALHVVRTCEILFVISLSAASCEAPLLKVKLAEVVTHEDLRSRDQTGESGLPVEETEGLVGLHVGRERMSKALKQHIENYK